MDCEIIRLSCSISSVHFRVGLYKLYNRICHEKPFEVEGLMKKLGEDLPEEEAEEMILQADKKGHGQLGLR